MLPPATIGEFSPAEPSSWPVYLERLEFFFQAHDITSDDKKRALLCSVCGVDAYALLRSLCAPKAPSETPFKDIIAKLNGHFIGKPNVTMERFRFNKRDQLPGESVQDFLAALRQLARYCDFENWLDRLLCDRLVCGLRDETIQRRLLAEPDLKLTKAILLARAAEEAAAKTEELRRSKANSVVDANQLQNSGKRHGAKGPASPKQPCWRCTGEHDAQTCSYRSAVCHFCGNEGHLEKACRKKAAKEKQASKSGHRKGHKKKSQHRGRNHHVSESCDPVEDVNPVTAADSYSDEPTYGTPKSAMVNRTSPAFCVDVRINNMPLSMEVDSGAACSIISERTMDKLGLPRQEIHPSSLQLRSYTKEHLAILGFLEVTVSHKAKCARLRLFVVRGSGTSLLGRDWFPALGISLCGINYVPGSEAPLTRSTAISEFPEVFAEGLGKSKGPPVRIEVNAGATPVFRKARQIPVALQSRADDAIDALVQEGVYQPVRSSRWATPVLGVVKKNGKIRMCGDYKSTVNQAIKSETYPLPTADQLFSNLAGSTVFSQLDLNQAYQQLAVDDETADLLTVNTHRGLFRVTRLPFGVSTAVAIFQRYMEELLVGLPGVHVYLDDIIVGGRDAKEHNERLRSVLKRIKDDNIRLNQDKCTFGTSEVTFLGYRIDATGIHPTEEKVEALKNAPQPENKQQLQSFLGLLNFYNRFLRGAAHILEPLHRLLEKNQPWRWRQEETNAFKRAKELVQASNVLVHYDLHKPLTLACDASPYGIGFVLSHEDSSGQEAPIAFGSRTLTTPERNYSQTDREALAVISGIKKFHHFLYGRHFKVYTDHKPLLGLLHHSRPMPNVLSPRMLRWNLLLAQYDYELIYRPGRQMGNADLFSRLPLPSTDAESPVMGDVLLLEDPPEAFADAAKIAQLTKKDPVLSRVLKWIRTGWPEKVDDQFRPYFVRRDELSSYRDCILWGCRVVIPPALRAEVLQLLHSSHPGIVRMKGLARGYVWWPKLDSAIECLVRSCQVCQESRNAPPRAEIHPWEQATRPWSRLHVDFAGPFQGKLFLIVVDSYSKWLEVIIVSNTSAANVIRELRKLFATHGLPDVVVSDNGSAFTSAEFRQFLARNRIRQALVAPYHPSSNGQAERFVQETKKSLKKLKGKDVELSLTRFLFQQHMLPCTATGKSPAELLFCRQLKSALDCLHPDSQEGINTDQDQPRQKSSVRTTRTFSPSDSVFARNFSSGPRWLPAIVCSRKGPLSYEVRLSDGVLWRRHVDHLRKRNHNLPEFQGHRSDPAAHLPDFFSESDTTANADPSSDAPASAYGRSETDNTNGSPDTSPGRSVPDIPRRSTRERRFPSHLQDYV